MSFCYTFIMKTTKALAKKLLPKRKKDGNKGDFGKVLIIGGSKNMGGACVLAGLSAYKSGAGYICMGMPKSAHIKAVPKLLEATSLILADTSGTINAKATTQIKKHIKNIGFDVMLIGVGLGLTSAVESIIKNTNLPLVIDADAINYLAKHKKFNIIKNKISILTPHPKEAGRILNISATQVQKNRLKYAKQIANKTNSIVILKGYETIITNGTKHIINTTGNNALAKAGSGDVLAGLITGLWAQIGKQKQFTKKSAFESAVLATYLHGLSADIASKKLTNYSVLATDIINHLPDSIRKVSK